MKNKFPQQDFSMVKQLYWVLQSQIFLFIYCLFICWSCLCLYSWIWCI